MSFKPYEIDYMKRTDTKRYEALIARLGLRH